jgi:drug/metabolite transporter (DMT)-like permease
LVARRIFQPGGSRQRSLAGHYRDDVRMTATPAAAARDDRSVHLAGIGLMLAGIGLFSFGDALGKHLVATYSVGQLMALRAFVALVLLAPFIWRARAEFAAMPRPALQLLRVALSAGEVAAFFAATIYLPLADVITFYLAGPIFVTALSAIFLGEQVGWRRWSAITVGFCGVLIALKPSAQTVSWPALIALGGSLSFAVLMVVTRFLRGTSDMVLASSQFVASLLFGAVLAPIGWATPAVRDLGLFVLAACISVGALLCVNRSLKLAPASIVVPYQYTMIVWAGIFGYLVFGDVPSTNIMVGASVIVGAGLYIFLRERSLAPDARPGGMPPA